MWFSRFVEQKEVKILIKAVRSCELVYLAGVESLLHLLLLLLAAAADVGLVQRLTQPSTALLPTLLQQTALSLDRFFGRH